MPFFSCHVYKIYDSHIILCPRITPYFSESGAEQITRARRRLSTINDKPLTEIDGDMGDLTLKEKEEKAENVGDFTSFGYQI